MARRTRGSFRVRAVSPILRPAWDIVRRGCQRAPQMPSYCSRPNPPWVVGTERCRAVVPGPCAHRGRKLKRLKYNATDKTLSRQPSPDRSEKGLHALGDGRLREAGLSKEPVEHEGPKGL